MLKYSVFAAGFVLTVALAVFFLGFWPSQPADPAMDRLGRIAELAERTCLSNSTDSRVANIKLTLATVKGIQADAHVEARREAARGAAMALPAEVQKIEDEQIRVCMQPWAQQLRDLASTLVQGS